MTGTAWAGYFRNFYPFWVTSFLALNQNLLLLLLGPVNIRKISSL
jgi:hypothetical protein